MRRWLVLGVVVLAVFSAVFTANAKSYVIGSEGGCWHNDCVPSGWCTWWNLGDQIYVINPDGSTDLFTCVYYGPLNRLALRNQYGWYY